MRVCICTWVLYTMFKREEVSFRACAIYEIHAELGNIVRVSELSKWPSYLNRRIFVMRLKPVQYKLASVSVPPASGLSVRSFVRLFVRTSCFWDLSYLCSHDAIGFWNLIYVLEKKSERIFFLFCQIRKNGVRPLFRFGHFSEWKSCKQSV